MKFFKHIYSIIGYLFLISALNAVAQDKFTIDGYVKDQNGEELIGANVFVGNGSVGTITNVYGYYSLTLPTGEYDVTMSFIGYEPVSKTIVLNKNINLDQKLNPANEQIEEVEIRAEKRDVNVQGIEMSTNKLPIKTIKRIPVLMGETDIIKSIQLLPGVQVVGEGNSGFFVRGGAVDQNLILLDEATVYNPTHIGGFFSVFNGDAIKNVELYKGGIPSYYGGRLSSVLDIRMKDGNNERFSATGGIGAISSRLTLEGPIVKSKGSFILSGRRTYVDLFFPLFNNEGLKESRAYFHDFNAKANYRINENNRVFVSAYTGRDVAQFGELFEMSYGNITGTLRWNHVFSNRLFANYTLISSNFDYSLGQPEGSFAFNWQANVIDKSFKNDYTFYLNPQNTIHFGFQAIHHTIKPGHSDPVEGSVFQIQDMPPSYGMEYGVFFQNEQKLTKNFSVNYGIRFSAFQNIGKGTIYDYNENFQVVDTTKHSPGKVFNTFRAFEPRLGMRYLLNNSSSLKASYNRMTQYVHLAVNTTTSTPLDLWFLSNPNIKPQYADQVALGYFRNFKNNAYELSLEAYYKDMKNAIDFKDHASLLLNEQFDGELRFGKAYSYGLEFQLKKQEGNLTGWISYTLSKTRRKINGINGGKEYPTPYDRPHDLKIVTSYEFSDRLNVSANWIYATAMPYTVAKEWYPTGGLWVPYYSERNSYRVPGTDYHRLDLAVTWKNKPQKKWESSWTLSVYNAYNRHNMYSIVYENNKAHAGPPEMNKMYLFGILPTITYNFKF